MATNTNNQIIPSTADHRMIHEKELHRLTSSWIRIPPRERGHYLNQFLLKRADLHWILGNTKECFMDLDEINSNGLPIRLQLSEWLMIYQKWKNRASEILESSPSLAKFLSSWCIPGAQTPREQAQCLLYHGLATWFSGDQRKGMQRIEELSESYPDMIKDTALSWKQFGTWALEDKDFSKAKNLLKRSLILLQNKTSQNNEMVSCLLSNLATAYFHLDEYQTALEKGNEAYALNPVSSCDKAERWTERAERILKKGNFELSVEYCTLAIKLIPGEANYANLRCSLLSCRSVAYAKMNYYEKALEDATECMALTSTADPSAEMYIKFLAVRGNSVLDSHPSLAEIFFSCSFLHAEKEFDEARCLLYKGVAFWLSGKQAPAMTVFQEASQIHADIIQKTVLTWKKGGIKALEDKDFTTAKNLFQRSLILLQSETASQEMKASLLSNLATAYFHLDEYQTALEKGNEAYALNPVSSCDEAERWKERVQKIPIQDSFELLVGYLTLAIKFAPEGKNFGELRFVLLSSRCDTYVKMNQYDQALEDAEKCLEIKPSWLKGHQQLGDIFNHLGRHREAVHSYCKAFGIADFPEKNNIIQQILLVSEKLADGTADVVLDVPKDIVNDMIKTCVSDKDWAKLRLLFIGGGGPHKYDYGKGGLAVGCDASDIPLELVVDWGIENNVEYLPEFLDELLKHGAPISGSPGRNESPVEIADRRQDKGVLQVFEKYNKSQGTMWRKKGAEAYDSGDLKKAIIYFKRSMICEMEFQERMEVHLALSKAYFETKNYQDSISTCDKVLLEFPVVEEEDSMPSIKQLHFELLCLRGNAYYHQEDLQQALQDGIKAMTINSDEVKGYALLVSCYKGLEQRSELLSALNECLKRERNSEKQWKLLKDAIDVAMNLPEETTCITADISVKLLKRLHKEAVSSKDWKLLRLLYLGGGGPEKFPKGKGGIATGRVSASNIPIEDVISAKFKGRLETLSVLLEQGASVNGLLNKSNPLVTAVDKGQVEVAKILLKYNANPCIKTDDNQPLVHKVVKKAMKGNLTMLNCFLDSHHPSIPNVRDSSGNSLYHLAVDGKYSVEKCKVIRCLLNANVNPLIPNKKGNLPTDCCKKTDDRCKMISKAIREIAKNENFNSTNDVTQADHQQSTEQDSSSTPNTTPVTTSKLVPKKPKKPKKKDVRKELEELIENLTITERNIDMHFEDDVKLEASSLPEATKGPDEEMLACESASEETGEAVIQEIDEIKFDDLPWEVDFSDKFKKRFRGKKIQQDDKSRIVEKIKMLAQGRWGAVLHKRLEGQPKQKGILLFECKLTKGARILWEKTIAFSPRLSTDEERVYTDIIRVWDVVMDHGDLDHEIRNVVHSIVKSKERGLQCAIKVKLQTTKREIQGSQSGGIYLPSVYQKCDSGILHTDQSVDDKREYFPPASPETNEYNILKFYSFTSSIIEAFLDGESKAEINFPFKVTELEHAIINLQPEPPCPIILLGRSGTGKTTCCLYRLWKEFQNYWEKATIDDPQFPTYVQSRNNCSFREGSSSSASWQGASPSYASLDGAKSVEDSSVGKHEHFHPLFITKNDVLCNEVRKNFRGLVNTNSAIKSVVVCEDSLPNRIQDMGETSWPLIVSSRDWLLLLDASLPGDPFFQRKRDGSMQNKIIGWGKESRHMRRLPVDGEDQKTREMQEVTHAVQDTGNTSKILKRELTYQVFKDEFWSKIDRKIRHQMHPTLVWTEIRSFIKGSAEALKKPEGFLSLDEYKEIGRKRAPNFLGDRHVIYGVFDSYQKHLTSNGLFDEADLVHHLHKRLAENPELPWSIHSVYVDETQDFTQAELSLLIRCCRNRNRMFFTGDTAQSIMRGIAFRFDDIKTLLHDLKSYDDNINVPKSLFQLTHNYRSHSGIIKLASSVVKLLGRFFPQSFDKLEDDNALFDGPKPVLLESCSFSDLAMILRGNKRKASRIEFGAHQAVLVVSEEARDNMPDELKHGLVLTIYEAKGLEFDDVLIYNFFKDSQAKKEWRVVTSYSLEEQQKQTSEFEASTTGLVEIHEKTIAPTSRPLDFNYEQHKVLNPEFKLLYTAITRARVNIWFFDEDAEARGPMFEFFQRSGLVRMNVLKNTEETDEASLTSAFAESSTATQWRNKGIHYFNQRKWALATICFTNAGDERMTDKSKALRMVQEATEKQDNDMLCTAAVNLLKCDMLNKAADCLSKAGELLLLEKLYERMGKA